MSNLKLRDRVLFFDTYSNNWREGFVVKIYDDKNKFECNVNMNNTEGRVVTREQIVEFNTFNPLAKNLKFIHTKNEILTSYYLYKRFLEKRFFTPCGEVLFFVQPPKSFVINPTKKKSTHLHKFLTKKVSSLVNSTSIFEEQIIVFGNERESSVEKSIVECFKQSLNIFEKVSMNVLIKCQQARILLNALGGALDTITGKFVTRMSTNFHLIFNKRKKIIGAKYDACKCFFLNERLMLIVFFEHDDFSHIFTVLLGGCSSEDRKVYSITESLMKYYEKNIVGITLKREFSDQKNAMFLLGFSQEERDDILNVLSGLLHLGALEFEDASVDTTNDSSNSNGNSMSLNIIKSKISQKSTEFLKVSSSKLGVTEKSIKRYFCKLPPTDCISYQKLVLRSIYSSLVDYIVGLINIYLKNSSRNSNKRTISVLSLPYQKSAKQKSGGCYDFGMNYFREALLQYFQGEVYERNIQNYYRDGLSNYQATYPRNNNVIKVIENIFECATSFDSNSRGMYYTAMEMIKEAVSEISFCKEYFSTVENSFNEFTIKHSFVSEEIRYDSKRILVENRNEVLFPSERKYKLINLLKGSSGVGNSNRLINKFLGSMEKKYDVNSKYLCGIQDKIIEVMQKLNKSSVCSSFVYAVDLSSSLSVESMKKEMKSSGLFEIIWFMSSQFLFVFPYEKFYLKYHLLLRKEQQIDPIKMPFYFKDIDLMRKKTNEIIELVFSSETIPEDQIEFGKKNVYFKRESFQVLSSMYMRLYLRCIVRIQTWFRVRRSKKIYEGLKKQKRRDNLIGMDKEIKEHVSMIFEEVSGKLKSDGERKRKIEKSGKDRMVKYRIFCKRMALRKKRELILKRNKTSSNEKSVNLDEISGIEENETNLSLNLSKRIGNRFKSYLGNAKRKRELLEKKYSPVAEKKLPRKKTPRKNTKVTPRKKIELTYKKMGKENLKKRKRKKTPRKKKSKSPKNTPEVKIEGKKSRKKKKVVTKKGNKRNEKIMIGVYKDLYAKSKKKSFLEETLEKNKLEKTLRDDETDERRISTQVRRTRKILRSKTAPKTRSHFSSGEKLKKATLTKRGMDDGNVVMRIRRHQSFKIYRSRMKVQVEGMAFGTNKVYSTKLKNKINSKKIKKGSFSKIYRKSKNVK